MFQLVGYRSWNASRFADEITVQDEKNGIEIANEELAARIYDATYSELSASDLEFLSAMKSNGSETPRSVVSEVTGRSTNWVSSYRRRLLEAGVIEEPRKAIYSFALPGFAEYLQKQAEA